MNSRHYLKISGGLFLLFSIYRSYFWERFWENWINVFLNAAFDTAVCMAVVIFMHGLVEKRLNLQSRPLAYGLLWLFSFVASNLLLWALHYIGYTLSGEMAGDFSSTFSSVGFQVFDVLTLLMVGVSAAYSQVKYREACDVQKRMELVEEEKQKAELSFLKSQMNPHFIFNSLNTIYFSIDKGHPAREIVSTFSDLLRFQLYECSQDFISLKQEVAFLKQYLHLHKIRMMDSMNLQADLPKEVPDYRIAPLLIIPYIENALKHAGSVKGQKREVSIKLNIAQKHLEFSAKNSLDIHDKKPPREKGIGLKNAKRRMDLLFGDKYSLQAKRNKATYEVNLKIPLQ